MKTTGIGKRIRQARERLGLTQAELAEKIGITKSAITNYESDVSHPKEQILYKLFDALEVDANFLFQDAIKTTQVALDGDELDLVDSFRMLDLWEQKMIQQMIQSLIEGNHSEPDEEDEPIHYRTLMFYGGRPSAGTGNWLPDETSMSQSQIQVVDSPKTRKADFVLEIDGSSMEPRFSDGDMILVKHQDAVDPGEIGVFLVNGQAVVKQCQNGYLHSLNPDYEDIHLQEGDEVVCFGKVIGKL